MRRRTTLSFALILGLLAGVSTAPTLLAKQDQQYQEVKQDWRSSFSRDITIRPSVQKDSGEMGGQLPAFEVTFGDGAYIPERTYLGSMVVKVQSGTFAFRVQSEVLVDPQDEDIAILEAVPPIPLGGYPDDNHVGRSFDQVTAPDNTVQNCSGTTPNRLCLLDPDELGERFVRLRPGFIVYLPDNSTCFFCNTTALDAQSETVAASGSPVAQEQEGQPELLVWAPANGFNWLQLYETESATASEFATAAGSPVAQEQGLQASLGWMLDPGSSCH
jgi:hypothetical protein